MIEFTFNNKVYIATNLSLFKVNYRQELKMGFEIRKKKNHAKAEKFVKEMKKMYEKVKVALRKSQKEIKNIQIGIEVNKEIHETI